MSVELPPGTASYSDRNPEPENRQILTFIGLALTTLALIVILANSVLNVFVNGLLAVIPTSVDQQIGRWIVPTYEAMATPSNTQDTLNNLLDRLEAELPDDQQSHEYEIFFIDEATVNAAAIPGDRVLIYRGLLEEMDSENALMMVLGHELGHFANRDHMRQLGRSLLWRLAIASLFGDVGGLESVAVGGAAQIAQANFSQGQEYKADEFGLRLLNQAYGHVAGATDFFEELLEQDMPQLAFLASHPTSRKRIDRINRMIRNEGYERGERSALPTSLQFTNTQ
jgi:Zn-dependent protease with chaperone function